MGGIVKGQPIFQFARLRHTTMAWLKLSVVFIVECMHFNKTAHALARSDSSESKEGMKPRAGVAASDFGADLALVGWIKSFGSSDRCWGG